MKHKLVILLATWGNPLEWNLARYIIGDVSKYFISTLPVSIDYILKREGKLGRVLLLVQDTLIVPFRDREYVGDIRCASSYWSIVEDVRKALLERVFREEQKFRVRKDSSEVVLHREKSLAEQLQEIDPELLSSRKLELPGIGTFYSARDRVKVRFSRLPIEFEAITTLQLTRSLLKLLPEDPDVDLRSTRVKVYFDITHGINYMTTLTLDVLQRCLDVIATYVNSVTLCILNSEPYPRNVEEVPELNVHVVHNVKIVPSYMTYARKDISKLADFALSTFGDDLELREHVRRLWTYIRATLACVKYALPLTLLCSRKLEEETGKLTREDPEFLILETLNVLYDRYCDYTSITSSQCEVTVRLNVNMDVPDLMSQIISFCLSMLSLGLLYRLIARSNVYKKFLNEERVTLQDLEQIMRVLCRYRTTLLEMFKRRDKKVLLNKIARANRGGRTYVYTLFTSRGEKCKYEIENLIAHFGLEGRITVVEKCVEKCQPTACIAYSRECNDAVLNVLYELADRVDFNMGYGQ